MKVMNQTSNTILSAARDNFLAVLLILFAGFHIIDANAEIANNIEDEYVSLLSSLTAKSYADKEKTISRLSALTDVRVLAVFKAMLNAELYYNKENKNLIYLKEQDGNYLITDVLSGDVSSVSDKTDFAKVKTNNKLRKVLRGEIARLSLKNESADVRLAAVNEIIQKLDKDSADLLESALLTEADDDVRQAMQTGVSLFMLSSGDKEQKIDAINQLKGSLYPQVKVALVELVQRNADGTYAEKDKDLRLAAKRSLKDIESKIGYIEFLQSMFFGLSLGSVLLLAAIGLAITFGVMGVINMAHGELIMLGAYTTYFVQSLIPGYMDYSLIISIPAAFIVSGLFGILIERGVIRHLYGRPLETLLATFGISLILQQLVRTTVSAQNVIVESPSWMSGSLQINPVFAVTYNRLYIIIFSLMVFATLLYVLKRTVLGLQVRAVSQNRAMAKAIGVRSDWVDALTFGLGSGIAGIAGVALSQLTNVGPNLGQSYIIDSFMVVVFGGVGNLWGTLVAAMSLGVVNKFLEPWAGAVLAKIIVLVFIILFIQKRPRGLFPKKGRMADD